MGRAGKNTHRHMLNTGKKDVQRSMPEHKTKAVTNVPKAPGSNAPVKYAKHPNC
jgi:hypothetical protein